MIGHKQSICPSAHVKGKTCERSHEEGLQHQNDTPQCANYRVQRLWCGSQLRVQNKRKQRHSRKARRRMTWQAKTTKPTNLSIQGSKKPTPGLTGRQPKQANMPVRKSLIAWNDQSVPTELITSRVKSTTQKPHYAHSATAQLVNAVTQLVNGVQGSPILERSSQSRIRPRKSRRRGSRTLNRVYLKDHRPKLQSPLCIPPSRRKCGSSPRPCRRGWS